MDVDETPTQSTCKKCKEETRYQANLNPVHWIRKNMSQWHRICSDFSSTDPEKQQVAYKDLLDLKSKYPNDIPNGMKCTLNILKTRLQDKMFIDQIVENHLADDVEVLRDMYISAIKEFLDILDSRKHLSNDRILLNTKYEIPHWLVDIYHDICHSVQKPAIQNLRAAAHMCLDWLRDNYWINECEMASIWMKVDLKVKDDLRQMVTALNKYLGHYFEGNRIISSISDEDLRRHVEERSNKYDISVLLKMRQRLIKKKLLKKKDISISMLVLVKDIIEYLKQDSYIHMVDSLAEVFPEGNCFLPSKELMNILDPMRCNIDQDLPYRFLKIWNGIFEFLPQRQFIPPLIEKLLQLTNSVKESEEHQVMAALWVKTLANSLIAVRDTLKLVTHKVLSGTLDQNKVKIAFESKLMQKMAESVNMIHLRPQEVPAQLQKSSNLCKLLLSPNKWTRVYLQSLMLLLEPRMPQQLEILIDELVRIYTGELTDMSVSEEFTIHSAEDLKTAWMQLSKHEGDDDDNGDDDDENIHQGLPWVHNFEKWGSKPYHCQLTILTDDLLGANLWH